MDINMPLRRGFMLKAVGIEGECWITIRYERLPDFCFKCGRIGHGIRECASQENEDAPERNGLEFGA